MHSRRGFTANLANAALLGLALSASLFAQTGSVRVTAADPSGAAVDAQGELSGQGDTLRVPFVTGSSGTILLDNLPVGDYRLSVSGSGFETSVTDVQIQAGQTAEQNVSLQIARVGSSVVVRALPGNLDGVPGSTAEITREDLDIARVFSIKEALRKVTGIHIVDEDAFGLNLNVGIRGLNPRRTQRTLIMEDGAPVHLAPYSDPSAHYHTPAELVQSIEVIKGSGQILHGPQTVGGVMNFVTETPPNRPRGSIGIAGGNRDYRNIFGKLGTGGERGGILGHFLYREGAGTREGHAHRIFHGGLNGLLNFGSRQSLQLKSNYYEEDSKFTEGGMSQAQYDQNPLGNVFSYDRFNLERYATQALYGINFDDTRFTTNFYFQKIDRASYRQMDFPGDEMTANPLTGCIGAARTDYENFADLCGNKMRPRNYNFFGIEPRFDLRGRVFGMRNETTAGVRYHRENITRKRYNGLTPDAREDSPGALFRDWNTIRANAFSAYIQSRFTAGNWTFTPGLRMEFVGSHNHVLRRGNVPQDSQLDATQTLPLPGFGVTYLGLPRSTVFAGVHRGFAPPRPDDNFDPLDPNVVPVSPERSTNYEVGIRSYPITGLQLEATAFRIDFSNLIVPGETVGLPQLTWANAGRTLNSGVELGARYDLARLLPAGHNVYLTAAYTHVIVAKFNSDEIVDDVNVRGNRLPYAPEHTLSPAIVYQYRTGLNMNMSWEYVSRQFADALNQTAASADGMTGTVPTYTVMNAALNVPLRQRGPVLFVSGTNLADRRFIASRVDGIQPGRPRQVFGGIRWEF